MAVIQYSALLTQMRGKLGGSQFNKTFNGYSLQKKASQPRRDTPLQSAQRQRIQVAQRRWKEETPQRQAQAAQAAVSNPVSDRFGQQVVLSGYQQYVKMMVYRQLVGFPLTNSITTVPLGPRTADPSFIELSTFRDPGTGALSFTGTIDYSITGDASQSYRILVYITRVNPSGTVMRGYRPLFIGYGNWIDQEVIIAYEAMGITQSYSPGDYVMLRSDVVQMGAGARIYSAMDYYTLM